ncbi:MAG: polymerase sporulation-specific sigma factor [Actinomycetota bacterium]|jgi:RNA polymerase sporulation-specific sigma factor|nr:polymerase sporulation-specific sigma factor [Actinomycetota bacterium]
MSRFTALPLSECSDDDLAVRAQGGDRFAQQTLIERYRRFARAKGRGYFLVGGDSDDIEQEALIGLYKAIRDYQTDRQASFRAFAELCITRQIITAIKTATRQKHQPLNQYVSISGARSTDEATNDRVVEDLLDDSPSSDPADQVVSGERLDSLRTAMAEMLSSLEVDVLRLYVEGKSYQEIGNVLGRHVKSIDNALQRIKRKVDAHLADEASSDLAAYAV